MSLHKLLDQTSADCLEDRKIKQKCENNKRNVKFQTNKCSILYENVDIQCTFKCSVSLV